MVYVKSILHKSVLLCFKGLKNCILKIFIPSNTIIIGAICLIIAFFLHHYYGMELRYRLCSSEYWKEELDNGFEGFDNASGVLYGPYIVPNYVHFLRYGKNLKEVNFMDAVCILSAFKNQKPDKIIFHTNLPEFTGKYWQTLLEVPGFKNTIEFKYIEPVESIFNQKLSSWYKLWHGSDILRIHILSRFGGIFIDNDVYFVKNMDQFRRFEMAVEIVDEKSFGTMTLVAHKDARFLRLWLNSYKQYYGHLWYYNAGEKPKLEILNVRPELVHNAKWKFGVEDLRSELYIRKWTDWKSKFTIHTLVRHLHDIDILLHNNLNLTYPVTFDEKNIFKYNITTIYDMVLDCCQELLYINS